MRTKYMKCAIRLGLVTLAGAAAAGCIAAEPGDGEEVGSAEAALDADRTDPPSPRGGRASPASVTIANISTGGSGCPDPGDVTLLPLPDGMTFVVTFHGMELQYPSGRAVQVLNCIVSFNMQVPQGTQVALAPLLTHGYASLSGGARLRVSTQQRLAGEGQGSTSQLTLQGPYDGYYWLTGGGPDDHGASGSAVWSGCGGSVIASVNTSAILNVAGSHGARAAVNTGSGAMQSVVQLLTRPCS